MHEPWTTEDALRQGLAKLDRASTRSHKGPVHHRLFREDSEVSRSARSVAQRAFSSIPTRSRGNAQGR
jgi:hypothetical protein